MTNYEIAPLPVPANPGEVERVERRLEDISRRGGELVAIMPSTNSNTVLGIFRVATKGAARSAESE